MAGTPVWTPLGFTAIENIAVGDSVLTWTYDGVIETKVAMTFTHSMKFPVWKMILESENVQEFVWTTEVHPFFSNGEWIAAEFISNGDVVQSATGTEWNVLCSEPAGFDDYVFNFEIDHEEHSYIVGDNGFVVHNAKTAAVGGRSIPGGWTVVGEEGPELIRLPGGSDIFTARDTASMLYGGGGFASNDDNRPVIIQLDGQVIARSTWKYLKKLNLTGSTLGLT